MALVSPFSLEEKQLLVAERRVKPRVDCSYPALLRGHVGEGMKFEARAVLSNMSASGMYLRTKRHIQPGENVFVVVRLSTAPFNQQGDLHRLAVAGTVVRIEPKVDGTYGVALQLHQHRFL